MPNSRSCSACIAQRARSRTIGCPGRPARTDFTSIRTFAVLERSCSKSHFIPFANATSQNDAAALQFSVPDRERLPRCIGGRDGTRHRRLEPARRWSGLHSGCRGSPRRPRGRARAGRVGSADLERGLTLVHLRILDPCFRERNGAREQIRNSAPADTSRPGPRARPALLPTSHAHCGLKEASSGRPAGAS